MARIKMLTAQALTLVGGIVVGTIVILAAYTGSALLARFAGLYEWR